MLYLHVLPVSQNISIYMPHLLIWPFGNMFTNHLLIWPCNNLYISLPIWPQSSIYTNRLIRYTTSLYDHTVYLQRCPSHIFTTQWRLRIPETIIFIALPRLLLVIAISGPIDPEDLVVSRHWQCPDDSLVQLNLIIYMAWWLVDAKWDATGQS